MNLTSCLSRRLGPNSWAVPSSTMRTLPTRPRCQCRARVPDDQDAYLEAYEIYDQAVKLSRLQTRYELESAWQAESETGPAGSSPPTETQVVALLQEYGLSAREAAGLYKDLYQSPTAVAAQLSSNPAPSSSQPTTPPRTPPQSQPAASASASTTAGASWGGCGDMPVWDESLFDGVVMEPMPEYGPDGSLINGPPSQPQQPPRTTRIPPPAQPSSQAVPSPRPATPQRTGRGIDVIPLQRTDRGALPSQPGTAAGRAPAGGSAAPQQGASAAPSASLGGCGDVPVWDESLFEGVMMEPMPVYGPDGSLVSDTGSNSSNGDARAPSNTKPPTQRTTSNPRQPPPTAPTPASSAVQIDAHSASPAPLSLSQVAARLDRWQRVLPGVNPAKLAAADAQMLHADVSEGLRALITLIAELPGRNVMGMLERTPRLLWTDNLQTRLRSSVTTLVKLHPSRDEDIVKDMIAEYPSLVWRMEYYKDARLLDELPIEIQNMMIVADQGIGYTYRYYKNRRTNYMAEMSSDEPFEQQT